MTLLGLLGLVSATLVGYLTWSLPKVDALDDYIGRPPQTQGQNWLLVGADSRSGMSPQQRRALHVGAVEGAGADTFMLLHISESGDHATLVSLPRDSFTDIPWPHAGPYATKRGKLNSAYSFGGPRLLTRAIERKTGLRIDHYLQIDFTGFIDVVNILHGVRICTKVPIHDKKSGADLSVGCHTLDGAESLAYVRARHFDPHSDLGRVHRQRTFLQALATKMDKPTTWRNPATAVRLTQAGLNSTVVDESTGPVDLEQLATHLKLLTRGNATTTTVPIASHGSVRGVGSVVRWDRKPAHRLFDALKNDEPPPAHLSARGTPSSKKP